MAISSMTAFGAADINQDGNRFSCHIRALNSRFLEVSVKLPRILQALETEVLAIIKSRLSRGKIDVHFSANLLESNDQFPSLNAEAALNYLKLSKELSMLLESLGQVKIDQNLSLNDLLKFDGVLDQKSLSAQQSSEASSNHKNSIKKVLNDTLNMLKTERAREGASLCIALEKLLAELVEDLKQLTTLTPKLLEVIYSNYSKRLENLLKKLKEDGLAVASDLSVDRLHLEIGILTDKCDIEEELTRLRTHCDEFSVALRSDDRIGRKLDFLCQEMHREVNTMSNKLVQSEASTITLRMKQTVERLRQQVQNVE